MMIMAYSFEKILFENANFMINNVNNCVFSTDGVWNYAFSSKFWRMYVHVFLHFGIILRYKCFHKMLMKYGGMMFRDFFREKLHNLLRFCCYMHFLNLRGAFCPPPPCTRACTQTIYNLLGLLCMYIRYVTCVYFIT